MTVFMYPRSFKGTILDGSSGGLDSQKFQLPFPKVINRTIQVAGGDLFDFNYGQGGKLQPRPFTIVMIASATTPALLQAVVDNFFGMPTVGFYGLVGVFYAKMHDASDLHYCTAELADATVNLDAAWYDSSRWILPNIKALFKPINLFQKYIP